MLIFWCKLLHCCGGGGRWISFWCFSNAALRWLFSLLLTYQEYIYVAAKTCSICCICWCCIACSSETQIAASCFIVVYAMIPVLQLHCSCKILAKRKKKCCIRSFLSLSFFFLSQNEFVFSWICYCALLDGKTSITVVLGCYVVPKKRSYIVAGNNFLAYKPCQLCPILHCSEVTSAFSYQPIFTLTELNSFTWVRSLEFWVDNQCVRVQKITSMRLKLIQHFPVMSLWGKTQLGIIQQLYDAVLLILEFLQFIYRHSLNGKQHLQYLLCPHTSTSTASWPCIVEGYTTTLRTGCRLS